MRLTVNGNRQQFEDISTVLDLLEKLQIEPRTVVVEVNEKIVRREKIAETPLSDRDSVEILRFVGGG